MTTRLKDVGEFGLIERIRRLLPGAPDVDVIVGIGDDVAVLETGGGSYLLATCDCQVEGVHFLWDTTTPFELGRKAAAVNLSDIAAMGGAPRWALVSLMAPQEILVESIEELYRGLGGALAEAGAVVVGGNTAKSCEGLIVDITLLGRVAPEHLLTRSGARPGDVAAVTGTLGDARAGLELWLRPESGVPEEEARTVKRRYTSPQARLLEGQCLGRCGAVHAMLDVSDGLLSDLRHMCEASGVGVELEVERVPVSPALPAVAAALKADALAWALTGGEDYELLFAVSEKDFPRVADQLLQETGTTCRAIGRFVDRDQGLRLILEDGRRSSFDAYAGGWDHFKAT